ncbi:ankyrin repeat domain-containing protein [Actinoplanes sp. NPDC024001]|uniref:ankyrin repeat domain-containing protein n=1 Tax=Actinoplanes sp. NPDC024001 TaxID=3154598 RepID=UPI0033F19887
MADVLVLDPNEPLALTVTEALHSGDVPALRKLLAEHPDLVSARVGGSRTLLHVLTDWPGHFPNGAAAVAALVEAGADVDARFAGSHQETPLHWAASCDDVAVLDALLDAGAPIDAPGAVIGGGTPLDDATAFGQWRAAYRLVERGARTTLWHAAALGLLDRLRVYFAGAEKPAPAELNNAFWGACHGGRPEAVRFLAGHGADLNWIPTWENLTPLDAAVRSDAADVVTWLRERGAKTATR